MKRSEIITQQRKALENPSTIDIKAVTVEHPKCSRKLAKSIRHAEKVSQGSGADKNSNSPLYIKTTISEKSLDDKNAKITISCL